MFITLVLVSLFAAAENPLQVIEKREERERLKLQIEHEISLYVVTLDTSNEKQDLERRLEQERALKSLVPTPQPTLLRSVGSGVAIPEIAKGYEEIYLRFINGKLIYRPLPGNDTGRIDFPIAELANPLMGIFDLSRCGNTGQYLSIATGYKKGQIPANAKKTEIWLVPRFLIENEMCPTDTHFSSIMSDWPPTAPIGIFWTWGSHTAAAHNFDYLTNQSIGELSNNNLFEKWGAAKPSHGGGLVGADGGDVSFYVSVVS
jgi:hypothetical protein